MKWKREARYTAAPSVSQWQKSQRFFPTNSPTLPKVYIGFFFFQTPRRESAHASQPHSADRRTQSSLGSATPQNSSKKNASSRTPTWREVQKQQEAMAEGLRKLGINCKGTPKSIGKPVCHSGDLLPMTSSLL